MLTKATFCKALRMIKEQDTINDEVAAALGKVSDGCYTFGCNNKWFDALMMVLKEAVNDRYFEPTFDVNDSFADVFAAYLGKQE